MRRAACLLAFVNAAQAATLEVDLTDNAPRYVNLPVAVDDAHLADPPGYFAPQEPVARVVRRITIENTGPEPVENPDIRLNGRPLLPADPLATLGVEGARDLVVLYSAWRDRVIHATPGLESTRHPAILLDVFGAAYCGDDARALAALTATHGGEVRYVRLNGHSVAEHRHDEGPWAILDGDQNLIYLDWDNRTLIGEAEIHADPLLALRTQVFGRQSAWQLASAWQNTSRFELADASLKQKILRLKNPPPPRNWSLLPGEKVVIDLTRTPDKAIASNPGLGANRTLRAAACVVEFHARRAAGGTMPLPFPPIAIGDPAYEAAAEPGIPVLCQAARSRFPSLSRGGNTVESQSGGNLRLTFDYQSPDLTPTPPPVLRVDVPKIHVESQGAERVWWQVSPDREFRIHSPNLDRVGETTGTVALSAIDETFLSPGTHYARAKVRVGGVWSDWSETAPFDVKKPPRPRDIRVEKIDAGQTRIRWEPCGGEMLVFGSDRLDFLPEIYGDTEITQLENGAILGSKANQNLLATVAAAAGESTAPARACYRLVARESGALSVPSAILRAKDRQAHALQTRHEKAEGALTGRDVGVVLAVP